ncbi:MAG: SEC-C domain-containing protein [Candidatus Poribacteria bacterium]
MKGKFLLDPSKLNPNKGFLSLSSHWRPNPKAPNSDMPGQKLSMSSYIPMQANDRCLCGSGKAFASCCQQKRYWHPICLNPDGKSYSLLDMQSATFHPLDNTALRERLMSDMSLYCVENSKEKGFWIFWGVPALEDQYGVLCFGDIELKKKNILFVSAMSDLRMQILIKALKEIAGELLDSPTISHEKVNLIDKWAYGFHPKEKK